MKGLGIIIISLALTLALLVAGCGGNGAHDRLERIGRLADSDPKAAAVALDSVDAATLSEADRNLHTLLGIKIADKNYQTHTSAEPIERVIEYFGRHGEGSRYAEALYYGGRVNADLGDYPRALACYQSALDRLPENTPHLDLRANVLSQLARLLNSMRLHVQGIPYLRQTLTIDSIRKDTFNLVYDHQLLGAMLMHANRLDEAQRVIEAGKPWAAMKSDSDVAALDLYLAAIQYRKENFDSAMAIVRPLPSRVRERMRNVTLAYAAEIYSHAGVTDTACMYARLLVESRDSNNIKTGYKLLLSDNLIDNLPQDSLADYFSRYKTVLENFFSKNESNQFLIQNSMYNYSRHVRAREEAEKASRRKGLVIAGAAGLIVLLCLGMLFMKYRQKKNLLKLHVALENIKLLKESLERERGMKTDYSGSDIAPDQYGMATARSAPASPMTSGEGEEKSLRLKLRREIEEIARSHTGQYHVADSISLSEPYRRLQELIAGRKVLTAEEARTLWPELEKMVGIAFPGFIPRLRLLTSDQLKEADIQLAILAKCGVTSSQIASLLSISQGAVSSRKRRLGRRIFDEFVGNELVDRIITIL